MAESGLLLRRVLPRPPMLSAQEVSRELVQGPSLPPPRHPVLVLPCSMPAARPRLRLSFPSLSSAAVSSVVVWLRRSPRGSAVLCSAWDSLHGNAGALCGVCWRIPLLCRASSAIHAVSAAVALRGSAAGWERCGAPTGLPGSCKSHTHKPLVASQAEKGTGSWKVPCLCCLCRAALSASSCNSAAAGHGCAGAQASSQLGASLGPHWCLLGLPDPDPSSAGPGLSARALAPTWCLLLCRGPTCGHPSSLCLCC